MRDASAVEDAPLPIGNGTLVADRQCNQDARVRRTWKRRGNAIANVFARPLDVVASASSEFAVAHGCRIVAHVARRAQIPFEKPSLEVETVRIDIAVRSLEPQRQRPAFARMHGGRW